MKERIKGMTIEELVKFMVKTFAMPVTRKEYRTLGIPMFNISKRRRFSDVYRTLILYLIKRSIPIAFPDHSSQLLEALEEVFQTAYEDSPTAGKRIEERLKEFDNLIEAGEEQSFQNLALYITEMFEYTPKKLVYAARLNDMIEERYSGFIRLGKEIKIAEKNMIMN